MRSALCSSWSIVGLGLLMPHAARSATASAPHFESAYTHHDYAKCAERPSPQPDVIFVKACAGLNGIAVIRTEEPDASSVDFGAVNSGETLGLGSFFAAGDTVEWRGPREGGSIKPVAAIVRYATGPSIGRMNATRLVVYRLVPGKPSCVMGIVQGADANASARAIVDRHASGFVCGVTRRIARP